jgi:hypothetical protein
LNGIESPNATTTQGSTTAVEGVAEDAAVDGVAGELAVVDGVAGELAVVAAGGETAGPDEHASTRIAAARTSERRFMVKTPKPIFVNDDAAR